MSQPETRILIVDDEGFYIDVLVNLLREEYKVVVAKNGEQALKRAQSSTPPALILLDVLMPDMDGYSVCQQLKANPMTRDIPVIFLTVKVKLMMKSKASSWGLVTTSLNL